VVTVCSHEQPEPGGVITKSAPTPADRESARQARRNALPRPGRPKVPPERLHKVADLYRRHPNGQALLIVADVLGVSERTAARYVEKCRRDGAATTTRGVGEMAKNSNGEGRSTSACATAS
jgi:hypothetical protein